MTDKRKTEQLQENTQRHLKRIGKAFSWSFTAIFGLGILFFVMLGLGVAAERYDVRFLEDVALIVAYVTAFGLAASGAVLVISGFLFMWEWLISVLERLRLPHAQKSKKKNHDG